MPETSARCEKRKTTRIGAMASRGGRGERLDRLAIAADGDRGQYIFMALGPTV
jgi:hypothetical protein